MTPLRHRMIKDMQIRNLAPETQRAYLQPISQFARHVGKSPELLGPEDIRIHQLHLTRERQLSAGSIMVAVAALRFLYKVTLKREWSIAPRERLLTVGNLVAATERPPETGSWTAPPCVRPR